MTQTLYTLVPMLSLVMFVMSFTMRIYRRSVSSFITILMVAISSNAMYYGYIEFGLISIVLLMIIMFYRAVVKPANDSFIIHKYNGEDRRKC